MFHKLNLAEHFACNVPQRRLVFRKAVLKDRTIPGMVMTMCTPRSSSSLAVLRLSTPEPVNLPDHQAVTGRQVRQERGVDRSPFRLRPDTLSMAMRHERQFVYLA